MCEAIQYITKELATDLGTYGREVMVLQNQCTTQTKGIDIFIEIVVVMMMF